jgi:hypothetical protein
MPSGIKTGRRNASTSDAMKKSTFGSGTRNFSDLPLDVPGPGSYYPQKFTEASHTYSFPRPGNEIDYIALKKALSPGPERYFQHSQDPRNLSAAMN